MIKSLDSFISEPKKMKEKKPYEHKSFILSQSPIKNKNINTLISAMLMVILAINIAILIYANEILRTLTF